MTVASLVLIASLAVTEPLAENIDPDTDGSRYAYGENVGWLNGDPANCSGCGVEVSDFEVIGWMWGENIGWVSLSCNNTSSCGTVAYGVDHDGAGTLSGYAWAENAGWVSFSCENTSSCGTTSYGVSIDPVTGDFSGNGWSENTGWVTFSSAGANPYKLKTGWNCDPPPATPGDSPALGVDPSGSDALLSWGTVIGATGYDVVQGELNALRSSGGDFAFATDQCIGSQETGTSLSFSGTPSSGNGYWFLVRGANCAGGGTHDTGSPTQVDSRDAEIAGSGVACP